jgi:hypothetical protein
MPQKKKIKSGAGKKSDKMRARKNFGTVLRAREPLILCVHCKVL